MASIRTGCSSVVHFASGVDVVGVDVYGDVDWPAAVGAVFIPFFLGVSSSISCRWDFLACFNCLFKFFGCWCGG